MDAVQTIATAFAARIEAVLRSLPARERAAYLVRLARVLKAPKSSDSVSQPCHTEGDKTPSSVVKPRR